MAISMDEFLVIVDRSLHGTPAGRGWGVYDNLVCDYCGHIWIGVALIGTKGRKCPHCGDYDEDFCWMPKSTGIAGDGVALYPVGGERVPTY